MGTKILLTVCLVIFSQWAWAQSDKVAPQKTKTVQIEFDGKQSNHKLTNTELVEKSAYYRHVRRMRSLYNQPIMPDFK